MRDPANNEGAITAGASVPASSTTPLLDTVITPADLRGLPRRSLRQLADELRQETIAAVAVTGGHLGAGLGVVELTTALHYVFNTPRDKLIWDVGHQCYPHKILTGRRDRIRSLRQGGGLSGFTRRAESRYDPFGAAHSSTSISAGLGFAAARDLKGEDFHVVSVIGDGAMSAGMAYEALNNAGDLGTRLVVVLNDNEMSISPPVGAMSAYLSSLHHLPAHDGQARDSARTLFEHLGFDYVGPVDGHDIDALVDVLSVIRAGPPRPVLVHVLTEKGKGYAPAEASPDRYHGVARFDIATGVQNKPVSNAPAYQTVFAESLITEARDDRAIVAVTAAMPSGTGLDLFGQVFPTRTFDVGIAEQHAVTFAAGLACEGLKPFCAIYSSFLQRGYDQIVHDVALQNLPVRFAIDRAGLVGADGPTHAGAFDLAYLGCLPNMVVMAPADEVELMHMVATAADYDEGPIAFRYPRGDGIGLERPARGQSLEIGRGRILREGQDVALLALGSRVHACLQAADVLEAQGYRVTVADARFAKPLDLGMIVQLTRHHEALFTVEEASGGGFGAAVLEALARLGRLDHGLKLRTLSLPDQFQPHDTPAAMLREARIDASSIAAAVIDLLPLRRRSGASVMMLPHNAP